MSSAAPSPSSRSGCAFALLLFGLVVGLGMAVGGGFLLAQAPGYWREMQEPWTETEGTILAAKVSSFQVRTGNAPKNYHHSSHLFVALDCHYEVAGKEFTGKELSAPKQPINKSDAEEAIRIAETYRIGDRIAVFHHPTRHGEARLQSESPNGVFVISVVFGPVIIAAGIGLAWWVWADWRAKRLVIQE